MPKKPQHLSLVASTAGGYGGGPSSKPKYSLTLHNSKLATGGKHLRDGLQQRQHLKAVDGVGLVPVPVPVPVSLPTDEVVGVHLKAGAITGEASGSVTRQMGESGSSGSGKDGAKCGNDNELGGGVTNGVMRAQNNRLWYH
ncbi:uncharacterized protein LOC116801508 [Drosophila sechellia]|uniref:uncharacterized protein LOC116801508 n=1 Tax=Drosophila sechellia TaxID=7238 RepID=UPI0013DDD628|nr:uncharacterized protein LOC116801508 [Drosophila sechellia]